MFLNLEATEGWTMFLFVVSSQPLQWWQKRWERDSLWLLWNRSLCRRESSFESSISHPLLKFFGLCYVSWLLSNTCGVFVAAHRSEVGILTSTALLCRVIRQVTSGALLQEMVYFLLGEEREPETPATIAQIPLRHRLIEHCDHLSDEVLIGHLLLFRMYPVLPMNLPLTSLMSGWSFIQVFLSRPFLITLMRLQKWKSSIHNFIFKCTNGLLPFKSSSESYDLKKKAHEY